MTTQQCKKVAELRRVTHFQECLNQFQAKQRVNLNDDVLMQVMLLLREKYGVTKPEDIELSMIRPTLKELDRRVRASTLLGVTNPRKLYEHYMLIYARLSGKPAPQFTHVQACNMMMLFRVIQAPFEKHCPVERTNFLPYNYCLYKFCQLLEYSNFLPYFSLLKCDDKLAKCDDIMKKIFQDFNWRWIPTRPDTNNKSV